MWFQNVNCAIAVDWIIGPGVRRHLWRSLTTGFVLFVAFQRVPLSIGIVGVI